jgi:hydroxymethylglutaryl-CoA synthase
MARRRREMIGITAYGAYLPRYRLTAKMINEAWGRPGGRGEKAIGYFDEDSLTMGLSAVYRCLQGDSVERVESLYFASTTSPFKEKLASTEMAMILNLSPEARTLDIGYSLRSGTSALLTAIETVKAGSLNRALVVASDCGRLEVPGGFNEAAWGDGAAAVAVGRENVLLNLLDHYCYSDELTHFWRRADDQYVKSEDVRFPQVMGYGRIMETAIGNILKKSGYKPDDFAKIVVDAPDPRSHQGLMRKFGFDSKTQAQDPLLSVTGSLGAAHPLVMLVSALQGVKPGDKILLASYGDGSDVLIFEATDVLPEFQKQSDFNTLLDRKELISSYTKYLAFKKTFPAEFQDYYSSISALFRERDRFSRLLGGKCKNCGYITTLALRVCPSCRKKDQFENIRLAREGVVFTFTQEWYYPSPEPPTTLAVVDLERGGRIYCQMTDCSDPGIVKIGMPVEMTVRKYHEALDLPHYYWKCKPIHT